MPAAAAAAAAAVAEAAAGAAALPASNMPWESLLKHRPRRLDWLSTKLNELNKVKQINQNNLNNLNKSYFFFWEILYPTVYLLSKDMKNK